MAEDTERTRIVGRIFEPGEPVETDGRHFENCVFDRCVFVYRGGQTPVLENNSTNGPIPFQFEDAARNTIEVLSWLRAAAGPGLIDEILGVPQEPAG